jgi:serine protease Do
VVVRVAAQAGPAIVGIYVEIPSGSVFRETGSGSGIIMAGDGYILTNNHVVSNSQGSYVNGTRITVYLEEHANPYSARLVGRDPQTDLAVIKIEAVNLPAAVFGDSDAIRVGQMTVAIGNPAGLDFMGSVTSGIISGLDRQVVLENGVDMRLIQTDAAINPGNSGGALLDSAGRVIGINSAGLAKNEYEGVNFAIPSNLALRVYADLKANTSTNRRPYLGVTILPDAEYAKIREQYGLPSAGVRIESVAPGGPAETAGLAAGDVIIAWNGTPIGKLSALTGAVGGQKPGDAVVLAIYRPASEKEVEIRVVMGERFD